MLLIRKLFLLSMILLMNMISLAGSFLGGQINWSIKSGDTLDVTVLLIQDCDASGVGSNVLYLRCANTGILYDSFSAFPDISTDVTPVNNSCSRCSNPSCTLDLGFMQHTYKYRIYLSAYPHCCDLELFCTRNKRKDAQNIKNDQDLFLYSRLNPCAGANNRSALSQNPLLLMGCRNQALSFNPACIDWDDDSLVFTLHPAYSGLYTPVIHELPYTYDNPFEYKGFPDPALPFEPDGEGFHVNPLTGDIQFTPVHDFNAVLCLKISEYRQGLLIGETYRDFMVISRNCSNTLPEIKWNKAYYREVFTGTMISDTIRTFDNDAADFLTIKRSHQIGNSIWTDFNGLTPHPSGTFQWTPTYADVREQPYCFVVGVQDDASPLYGMQSRSFCYKIKATPEISGTIFTDNDPLDNFNVQLIQYDPELTGTDKFQIFQQKVYQNQNTYSFTGIPEKLYILKAFPCENSQLFNNYFPTYYGNDIEWEKAKPINTYGNTYNIDLQKESNNMGAGEISGRVEAGGVGVAGIELMLFKSGSRFRITHSNKDGSFSFTKLPYGDYEVHVELLGIKTYKAAIRLDESQSVVKNLIINIIEPASVLFNWDKVYSIGDFFPNPASSFTSFSIHIPEAAPLVYRIISIEGILLKEAPLNLNRGDNIMFIPTSEFDQGIYILHLYIDDKYSLYRKLIIN
jgi:hypothetical protein